VKATIVIIAALGNSSTGSEFSRESMVTRPLEGGFLDGLPKRKYIGVDLISLINDQWMIDIKAESQVLISIIHG